MELKPNFYDNWECDHAFSLIKTDPEQAKICYEEYIKEYPNDYRARFYYNYVLIILGEVDQAERELEKIREMFEREKFFKYDHVKMMAIKRDMIQNTIRVLLAQEKYQECYDYYLKHQIELNDKNLNSVIFYCRKKLGLLTEEEINKTYEYSLQQIINYSEESFFEHIKKRLPKYVDDNHELKDSVFSIDFPVEKVVQEIKKYIPSEKGLAFGYYDDKYVFKYDYCGRVNNKIQNYFIVCVHRNTQEFITMYPAPNCDNLPNIDLNYLCDTFESNKVKQKSQIDKFRERYKRV